jgi:hypothetical protein
MILTVDLFLYRAPQFLPLVLRFFVPSAFRAQKQQLKVCSAVIVSKLIYQFACICVH